MRLFAWFMTGFNASCAILLMGAGLTTRAWFFFALAGVNSLCAAYFENQRSC